MKNKQIEIERMVDAEYSRNTLGYFCKGHHDKLEFIRILEKEYDVTVDQNNVHHEFYRKVKAQKDDDVDYRLFQSKPGRGAFAVTIYYCEY